MERLLVRLGDVAVKGRLNLLGAGRVATLPPSVAVALHQFPDKFEIAGKGDNHNVVTISARPDERIFRCHRGDPDRRARRSVLAGGPEGSTTSTKTVPLSW